MNTVKGINSKKQKKICPFQKFYNIFAASITTPSVCNCFIKNEVREQARRPSGNHTAFVVQVPNPAQNGSYKQITESR